ncbi:MAG: hypothetical protein FWG74_03850, partial [Planctomycetes bacterium]|nr:hypothetical protein [Planctomycetota bacterium]
YDESFKVVSDWVWMRRVLPQIRHQVLDVDILAHRTGGVSSRDTSETALEKYRVVAPEAPGLTWEDYYPMRYPHNLTRENALQLLDKYAHCRELREALILFLEHEIDGGAAFPQRKSSTQVPIG